MSEPVDAGPFDLVPEGFDGSRAALLLHGFTGTPFEMRRVANELVARGYRCVGPVMAGHEKTHVELGRVHWREWIDVAAEHLERLSKDSGEVVVAGMSMGGLVTLSLGASHTPAAIGAMGAPLWLPRSMRWGIPVMKYLRPYAPKSEGPDLREPEARSQHPGFDTIPVAATHQILSLQKHVRQALPRIICPTFVAHGSHDKTANPRDAYRILGEVNAGERALFMGKDSGHVISVDYDSAECTRRMGDFFDAALDARAASRAD